MSNNTVKPETQLEDVMAAMDVVDTLRHEQGIAERELDNEARRERLLNRLRDLYQAQGIVVTDHMLKEGIKALEEERFEYKPVLPSWRTKLAYIWVSRGRWGKPVGFLALLCFVFLLVYLFIEVIPQRSMRVDLPNKIQTSLSQIKASANDETSYLLAEQTADSALRNIDDGEYEKAQELSKDLISMSSRLDAQYDIRVVSRIDENSGVWRVPPGNPDARNFYLIVEALDSRNRVVDVDVLNQENNKWESVDVWGIRVSEKTFYQIAADKNDDGIIQNNRVGQKKRGDLKPIFSIDTTGAAITEW